MTQYDQRYGINISEKIREFTKNSSEYSLRSLAHKLGISANAMNSRLNRPYYSNLYDIIEVSKYLKVDLLSDVISYLEGVGVEFHKRYSNKEIVELEKQLESCMKQINRYEKTIDLLIAKG